MPKQFKELKRIIGLIDDGRDEMDRRRAQRVKDKGVRVRGGV